MENRPRLEPTPVPPTEAKPVAVQAVPAAESAARRPPATTWILYGVKAAVAIGLILLLVRTIKGGELLAAAQAADLRWILVGALLMPVNLLLQADRWRTALRGEMPDLRMRSAFTSLLGGMSLGIITPGRVGEVGRVFLLKPPSRVRLAGLHMLDKFYFLGALGGFGPALLYHMPGFSDYLPPSVRPALLVMTSILPVLYLFLVVNPGPLRGTLVWVRQHLKASAGVLDLLHALDKVRSRDTRRMTLLTALQFAVILTQFHVLSLAFQNVAWWQAAHTYLASLFVKSLLPISLGDIGVGEWAAVGFYARYGIADTTAFSASLLIFGLNILLPALAGLVVLQRVRDLDLLGRVTRRLRRSEG